MRQRNYLHGKLAANTSQLFPTALSPHWKGMPLFLEGRESLYPSLAMTRGGIE